jgi:hypothetical protein
MDVADCGVQCRQAPSNEDWKVQSAVRFDFWESADLSDDEARHDNRSQTSIAPHFAIPPRWNPIEIHVRSTDF